MRVGLFDSGIGGLTVLRTLKRKYPHNDYIYYGDTLNVPYGSKKKEELIELAKNNIAFLINKKVDIIIIACGTVSANCLEGLQHSYDIPIYSIVSPVITYLNESNYSNIGVIATNATINSHIFKNNIRKPVYEIATPKLVPLIENNDNVDIVLHEYLGKLDVDILVLGCTHYPIIMDDIMKVLPNTKILDMSEFITLDDDNGMGKVDVYYSKLTDITKDNTHKVLKRIKYDIKKDYISRI